MKIKYRAVHSEGLRLVRSLHYNHSHVFFFPYSYFQTTMAEIYQLSQELLEACERGELGTVQKLISRGADPSYTRWWGGTTALHVAARYVYVCAQLI